MTKKRERSLLLACMLFVFVCLLLSGGWRLVASRQEEAPIPERPYASIRAAFSPAHVRAQESTSMARRESAAQRLHSVPAQDHQALNHHVPSDSNGNVLAGGSYMRAVYQAFVLDDGFV